MLDPIVVAAAEMEAYPVSLKGPAFRLANLQGRMRGKEEFRGRVVLLNFWASWCPPCREEFPSLERLQAQLGGKDFTVLAVSVADSQDGVMRFLGNRNAPFEVLLDSDGQLARAYRVAGVPVTYLLDREGRLLAGKTGPHRWDDPAMVELIRHTVEQTGGER